MGQGHEFMTQGNGGSQVPSRIREKPGRASMFHDLSRGDKSCAHGACRKMVLKMARYGISAAFQVQGSHQPRKKLFAVDHQSFAVFMNECPLWDTRVPTRQYAIHRRGAGGAFYRKRYRNSHSA